MQEAIKPTGDMGKENQHSISAYLKKIRITQNKLNHLTTIIIANPFQQYERNLVQS